MEPAFLCVVTPIFDGAIESIKLLVGDLKAQKMKDFIHVMVSAGPSPASQKFIRSLCDPRFIYEETSSKACSDVKALLINLGERRNHCFRKYDASRYVCIDADLKIIHPGYFTDLKQHHADADILITRVFNPTPTSDTGLLPSFPLDKGRIDLSNFSFTKWLAKNRSYPVDFHPVIGRANDWRFFSALAVNSSIVYLPITSAIIAGNNTYRRVSDKFADKGAG